MEQVVVLDRSAAGPLVTPGRLAREFREHLPIWFVYLSAIGLLHATLANFPDGGFGRIGLSRETFVTTTAFPLIWFAGYFVLRIHRSTHPANRRKAYALLAVLVVGIPAAVLVGYRPVPLRHDQLSGLFEAYQLGWVAVFLVQTAWARGRHGLLMFFGVTFVYGVLLENAGIVMRYFSEPSFTLYLGFLPAPLCTMLGWCLVLCTVVSVTDRFARWWSWLAAGVLRRVAFATALALSMDAQLDPLASMSGVFWRWNEALPPAFLGVPAINFAAWFGAVAAYGFFVFRVRERAGWSPGRRNWELFLRVPLASVVAAALCFSVMAVVEGGFDGPSFRIMYDFGSRLLPY